MADDSMEEVSAKRMKMSTRDLESLSKEELIEQYNSLEAKYHEALEANKSHEQESTNVQLQNLRESEEKLKAQHTEATKRENYLVMKLTSKDKEIQEYMNQIQDLKAAQNAGPSQLRSMLLDPAINLMFTSMKKEMDSLKEKHEQAQSDLAAWKFTPDSQTGKRLMAKCRMLFHENEELGKQISSGKTAKLESEIALEKALVNEMKASQKQMDDFLLELDEDVEGMQSTIYFLQQQLKETKDKLKQSTQEQEQLRAEVATQQQLIGDMKEQQRDGVKDESHEKRTSNGNSASAATASNTSPQTMLNSGCHSDNSPNRTSPTSATNNQVMCSPPASPSPPQTMAVNTNGSAGSTDGVSSGHRRRHDQQQVESMDYSDNDDDRSSPPFSSFSDGTTHNKSNRTQTDKNSSRTLQDDDMHHEVHALDVCSPNRTSSGKVCDADVAGKDSSATVTSPSRQLFDSEKQNGEVATAMEVNHDDHFDKN